MPEPTKPPDNLWHVFTGNPPVTWNFRLSEERAREEAANPMISDRNPRIERYISETALRRLVAEMREVGDKTDAKFSFCRAFAFRLEAFLAGLAR